MEPSFGSPKKVEKWEKNKYTFFDPTNILFDGN